MFEKEAEELANKKLCSERICYNHCNFNSPKHHRCGEWHRCYECAKEGAEFGYNKANKWHYMKDVNCYEDLHFPPEEEAKGRVLIWKVQVITEKGIKRPVCYHCGSYDDLWYEMNAYHVIAWKEIVLPELKESK